MPPHAQASPRLSRRAFLQAAGLAAGGALLAACTPGAPAATPTPDRTVNFLWTDSNNARQPLIADFTVATGIQVNQTRVQYNELLDKINTAVQAGAAIDVIEMDTIWTAQFAAAGWLQDLSDRLTPAIRADVAASALNAVTYQGKLYGMPWFNSCKHLFYNHKLLQAAGFTQPPVTLDELVAQAKASTGNGNWGSIWSWIQSEGLICDWLCLMFTQPGAQFIDVNGKSVFDQMGGVEALQWMVDLLYKHQAADPASLQSSELDVQKALYTGKYALTYNWEGILPAGNDPAQSQAAPNVQVALLPGGPGIKSATVNGSEGWAMLKGARHPESAWALLQYMASPAWQKKAALIAGDYPVLASLYADTDLQKNVQDFAVYGEQFQYMQLRPQVPGYAQKSDIIQKHLHEALLQKAAPAEAMRAAADEVNKATNTP